MAEAVAKQEDISLSSVSTEAVAKQEGISPLLPLKPAVELQPSAVLKQVCEESLMRGPKRKISLVARDTWMPEYLGWKELDADSYSRNGHPPKKLILRTDTNEMEIRGWNETPCRYGSKCSDWNKGRCLFMHTSCVNEVEVAAGSALRLRQILFLQSQPVKNHTSR
jgi:hypothetical protein